MAREKKKPGLDLDAIQEEIIDRVVKSFEKTKNIRETSRELGFSQQKVRKILITAGVFKSEMSRKVSGLYRQGHSVKEMAELLNTSMANVYSYLPYYTVIYNMDEKSVGADRQARYRERKKAADLLNMSLSLGEPQDEEHITEIVEVGSEKIKAECTGADSPSFALQEKAELESYWEERIRRRNRGKMVFVMNERIRRYLPKGFCSNGLDPLDRKFVSGYGDVPRDPERHIWVVDLTANGRGKKRQAAAVLECAAAGFAVVTRIPEIPEILTKEIKESDFTDNPDLCGLSDYEAYKAAKKEQEREFRLYRDRVAETFLEAIYGALMELQFPGRRVEEYLEAFSNIEFERDSYGDESKSEKTILSGKYIGKGEYFYNDRYAYMREPTNNCRGVQFVKSKRTMPSARCTELCTEYDRISERDEYAKRGVNIADTFNVHSNEFDRKFGYSPYYRAIIPAMQDVLRMTDAECKTWYTKRAEQMVGNEQK